MCNSSFRFVAWPLLVCLVISLVGADVLHYRLCHHQAVETSQIGGCTLHAHADGVVHTHAMPIQEPVPGSLPRDPYAEDCLVCQVLSHDTPDVMPLAMVEQTGLVVDLTLQETCQEAGKPLRRSLSRGPPRVSIVL